MNPPAWPTQLTPAGEIPGIKAMIADPYSQNATRLNTIGRIFFSIQPPGKRGVEMKYEMIKYFETLCDLRDKFRKSKYVPVA
jgi:hypothetical protein